MMRSLIAAVAVATLPLAAVEPGTPGRLSKLPIGTSPIAGLGCWVYLPADYGSSTGSYPLLVGLHGLGDEGDGSSSALDRLKDDGLPKVILGGRRPAAVVLLPQSPIKGWWLPHIERSVAAALATYRVDAARVCLTGYSAGGKGVWDYTAQHGQRLAAAMPIDAAGWATPGDAQQRIWAIHGEKDGPGNSTSPLDAWFGLPQASPQGLWATYPTGTTASADWSPAGWVWRSGIVAPRSRGGLTLLAGGGHGSWRSVYAASWFWTWATTQVRGPAPGTTTRILDCIADGHVRGGSNANSTYGSALGLELKYNADPQWTRRLHLRFELPAGGVASARLELSPNNDPGVIASYRVRRSRGAWDESALCWSNAPAAEETLGSLTASGARFVAPLQGLGEDGGSVDLVVESLTDSGGAPVQGFCAREHADPSRRPRLVIEQAPQAVVRR